MPMPQWATALLRPFALEHQAARREPVVGGVGPQEGADHHEDDEAHHQDTFIGEI